MADKTNTSKNPEYRAKQTDLAKLVAEYQTGLTNAATVRTVWFRLRCQVKLDAVDGHQTFLLPRGSELVTTPAALQSGVDPVPAKVCGIPVKVPRAVIVRTQSVPTARIGDYSEETVRAMLRDHADWSPAGAKVLAKLVQQYGAFVLRNAAALAITLGHEDGTKGF